MVYKRQFLKWQCCLFTVPSPLPPLLLPPIIHCAIFHAALYIILLHTHVDVCIMENNVVFKCFLWRKSTEWRIVGCIARNYLYRSSIVPLTYLPEVRSHPCATGRGPARRGPRFPELGSLGARFANDGNDEANEPGWQHGFGRGPWHDGRDDGRHGGRQHGQWQCPWRWQR